MGTAEMPNAILFDLDGTLVDSAPGILRAMRLAFDDIGLSRLSEEDERAILGPPLHDFLAERLGAEQVTSVIAAYRTHYTRTHTHELLPYPGIVDALSQLRARGYVLAICTSKVETFARSILLATGLDAYFSEVCGDTPERTRSSKAAIIAECLSRRKLDPARSVMVGDREHDVKGALHHGIPCLGITWGYGTLAELQSAGAYETVSDAASMIVSLQSLT